ncbi:rod shape-determining protein MreC [Parachryseolinea silvisoli]|uniref:rod shape-determining protein MreC n=1 Tax=Parachryseolinea silvisoli TaxID=2873601 RepID=UPI002265C44D|nr:rod shape-determining protein MreC [Parachryseolinea silvisoli]MCD9016071.1 rod shape-determining protein MreC [Parachryseolinea silvisoli]
MERLFYFIYQYRAFFTFLVLEVFCFWLVVKNNEYQGTQFFNSSNTIVASVNGFSQSVRDYFLLSNVNATLSAENAGLRRELETYHQRTYLTDSVAPPPDSSRIKRFDFVSAKVVNNHVDLTKNFITINKGRDAGIEPGMAVISPLGAVGKVKLVSEHYGVVTSLLHIDVMVSSVLKRTGHFGSVQWDGRDPGVIRFNFIPRHVKPLVGDTVVTSGFNSVFPEGIMVGTVSEVNLSNEALTYDLRVKLSQDFRKLSFLTVVKSVYKSEQDSLEQVVNAMAK